MKISNKGVAFIKSFEGLRLSPYRDAVGKWTVGYGHLMFPHEVKAMKTLTMAEAEELLRDDIADHEEGMSKLFPASRMATVTQGQWDALVSFAFNLGVGALKKSSLLRLFLAGDIAGASAQFDRWVNAGGRRLGGLVRRRAAERRMFDTGVWKA